VGIAVAFYFAHFGSARGEAADPATSILSQLLMMSNVLQGKNLPNVVWSLSYEMVFYCCSPPCSSPACTSAAAGTRWGYAAAAVAIGGVLPQAFFTHNVATPRLIALVADLAVLAGLAFAVVLRGTSAAARRGARRGGGDRAALLQRRLDLAVGGPVDPGADVHRDHVLPSRNRASTHGAGPSRSG